MIILIAKMKLGEGALDEAREAIEKMVTASLTEEGVIDYTFALDLHDPSVLRIAEKYVDQPALAAHASSAHMAEFQKALSQLDVKIEDLTMFNADEGTKLM